MKTYCGSCKTSSLNFLHKETGVVYCSSCGTALKLGIEIINALSSKKMFLPDDFFKTEEVVAPTRSLQVAAANSPPRAVTQKTAQQAALERRAHYTNVTTFDDSSVSSAVSKGPKISKEQAAANKAAAIAQTEQFIAEAGAVQNPQATWFKNKPNNARDIEQQTGIALSDFEQMIDPD